MKLLDAKKLKFRRTESGTLDLTREDGSVVENVHCIPLFPLSAGESYISVAFRKGSELEEIGVIRHVRDLPSEQQKLVREDIRFRYFVPEITDVKKVQRSIGSWEFEVTTDRGERTFILRHRRENIRVKDNGQIMITDVEKCRYRIPDRGKLSSRAMAELDKVLL